MPKFALLLLACVLVACSSEKKTIRGEVTEEQLEMVSNGKEAPKEETVGSSPGMIPADCEALLNNSQAWGYFPGEKWKPASPEHMKAVAQFFGEFRLVPAASSEAIQKALSGGPTGAEAQVCDPFLAQTFLQAILDYSWGKAERLEAGKQLHRFLLNQQALFLPLLHRALTARIYAGGVKRGLLPGSHPKAKGLSDWVEKESAAVFDARDKGEEEAKNLRRQLELSGKIRDKLGVLLPLP